MKQYKILISSTLGTQGAIVSLPDNAQTSQRLTNGIVAELKIVKPAETKKRAAKKSKS